MAKDRVEEDRKRSRRVGQHRGETADYVKFDAVKLRDAIATIAARGGAIRFGYTSDGGAYAIGIYGDGEPYTDYIRPNDDCDYYLDSLREAWQD